MLTLFCLFIPGSQQPILKVTSPFRSNLGRICTSKRPSYPRTNASQSWPRTVMPHLHKIVNVPTNMFSSRTGQFEFDQTSAALFPTLVKLFNTNFKSSQTFTIQSFIIVLCFFYQFSKISSQDWKIFRMQNKTFLHVLIIVIFKKEGLKRLYNVLNFNKK